VSVESAHGGALPVRVAGRSLRRRPRLALRLSVAINRGELDRELATGVDPASSEQLALRNEQLTGRRHRNRLAAGLDAVIEPRPGPSGLSSVLRPRADLRRSRNVLEALQSRLRSGEPLEARGIAVLGWLLGDSASPLYTDLDPDAVSSLLRLAAATMTPGRWG